MREAPRILLVSMPWASNDRPSLAVGVLTAIARAHGHRCEALYPTFDFAQRIGPAAYESLAENPRFFGLSEHLFACDLFSAAVLRSDEFLGGMDGAAKQPLLALRDDVIPAFVDEIAARIAANAPDIVGFSCTFNQIFASLAVARRLKTRRPDTTVLLGGACVHGPMGAAYARAFPEWVDHVFTGEADDSFPRFLEAWRDDGPISIEGVTVSGRVAHMASAAPRHFLDDPMPDFDDWFEQREATSLPPPSTGTVALPFESSRGCWWGEKSHCTFCGLNNEGMHFRSKPAARVAAELRALSARYQSTSFMAADNILDHRAFDTLLPLLIAEGLDLRLFYEIKANVDRDRVAAMAAAGIGWVQPGIESFSDDVLKLMGKGVSSLQNVRLLRLAAEYGIAVSYNVLVGFPGERDEYYMAMDALLPKLAHLSPPSGDATLVQVHRFSPFFEAPGRHGIVGLRPCAYYAHLLPPTVGPFDDFAYFFERDVPAEAPVHRWTPALDVRLAAWRAGSTSTRFVARLGAGFAELVRTGPDASVRCDVLDAVAATVLVLADDITRDEAVRRRFRDAPTMRPAVDAALSRLEALGAIARSGDRLVSVVPYERPKTSADLDRWIVQHGAALVPPPAPARVVPVVAEPAVADTPV